MRERKLKAEIAAISRQLHQMGFVANHDGNVSVRLENDLLACTPTAVSKRLIQEDDIITVDLKGQKVSGTGRPFSELNLHLAAYAARPEVKAVVHAHAPFATAFGVSGETISPTFLPEAVVSLGLEIPTAPLAMPGEPAVQALRPLLGRADAFLLAGNGILALGNDLEQAFLRLELVEHLCKIAHAAKALGGPRPLPADFLGKLLEARKKAGLGPQGSAPAPVSAQPPTPAPAPKPAPSAASSPDLRRLIAEELARALREK
jgi:L-fuculose-phosphate aldolase